MDGYFFHDRNQFPAQDCLELCKDLAAVRHHRCEWPALELQQKKIYPQEVTALRPPRQIELLSIA